MATRIEHPCIINGIIELDMLTPLVKQKNMSLPSNIVDKSRHWFPGYSTLSILFQLEGTYNVHTSCMIIDTGQLYFMREQ